MKKTVTVAQHNEIVDYLVENIGGNTLIDSLISNLGAEAPTVLMAIAEENGLTEEIEAYLAQ